MSWEDPGEYEPDTPEVRARHELIARAHQAWLAERRPREHDEGEVREA